MTYPEQKQHPPSESDLSRRNIRPFSSLDCEDDKRFTITLPQSTKLISEFAAELAWRLTSADAPVFVRNTEVVTLSHSGSGLEQMSASRFQTFVEDFVRPSSSMTEATARATLASNQFVSGLRRIKRIAFSRRPVIRHNGSLQLLPSGYDEATETLTVSQTEIDEAMDFETAVTAIRCLYRDACFLHADNGVATALAATLTLYCAELLPPDAPRPVFIFQGNATGAGKGTIAAMSIAPVFGEVVVSTTSQREEEVKKTLLPVVLSGREYLLLDNLKGRLESPSLEAFTTAAVYEDRQLGSSTLVRAANLATVFITGNDLRVSGDLARRSLTVELFLPAENAETYWRGKESLELSDILALRPRLLSALFCLVKEWDLKGRPGPKTMHGCFRSWSQVIAGIIEANGFESPCKPVQQTFGGDQDATDIRRLVEEVVRKHATKKFRFEELVTQCVAIGCFERITGGSDQLKRSETASLGMVMKRYNDRLFEIDAVPWRFRVMGDGHGKRFFTEKALSR